MAEKLSESNWTTFAKKQKLELDDGALIKALAKFDKTDESKPEPRLDAVKDVVDLLKKQVVALTKRKKELGDKVFGEVKDKLYALLAVAEELQKGTQAAMSDTGDDDEEDTPVLLTTKMIPLLRELRKGQVSMHAMICAAGKNTALLIMRRPIAPARRKLLAEAADVKGAARYIVAECFLENKALTFVVQSQAAGLAKRVRQALLDQTALRLKVKVRGEDGAEDEDGGDDDEGNAEGNGEGSAEGNGEPAMAGEAPSLQAAYEQLKRELYPRLSALVREAGGDRDLVLNLMGKAGKVEKIADWAAGLEIYDQLTEVLARQPGGDAATAATTAAGAGSEAPAQADRGAAFNARLATLLPRVKNAIAAAGPNAQDIKLKVSEAGMFARKREFDAADEHLDQLTALLARQTDGGAATVDDRGPAFNARLAALMPKVKDTIAAAAPNAQDIKLKVSEAGMFARKREFDAASALLDQVDELLKPAGGDVKNAAQAQWDSRFAEVEQTYLKLLEKNPADATKLRAVMGFANDQAEAGQYAKGVAALDRLEGMLAVAQASLGAAGGASDTGYVGIVAYRKSLLAFRQAVVTVEGQIANLKAEIPSQLPGETELADDLEANLKEYNLELLDAVDEAMKAAENENSPVTQEVAKQLDHYLKEVMSSPLIKHVDNNPFGVTVTVEKIYSGALEDIRAAMPALQ